MAEKPILYLREGEQIVYEDGLTLRWVGAGYQHVRLEVSRPGHVIRQRFARGRGFELTAIPLSDHNKATTD